MSLALIGKGASFEFRWRRWALLRDTVAASLEHGHSGRRFPRLAALGDALGEGSVRVPAGELGAEIAAVRGELAGRSVDELAVGPRTAMVLYATATADDRYRPLTRVERSGVAPAGDHQDLAEYFASLLDSIAHVCRHPLDAGDVEVVDG